MPVAQTDEYKVLEIKTLGKDRDAEARQMLERVAKQVQPIMRKRQWTVRKLSEFIPRSPNLLGLNVNRYEWDRIAFSLCLLRVMRASMQSNSSSTADLLLPSASLQSTQHACTHRTAVPTG
jgi:hypothetical protein